MSRFMSQTPSYQQARLQQIDTCDAWGLGEPEQTLAEVIEEYGLQQHWQWRGFTIVTDAAGRVAALFDNHGPCIEWLDA
jgi:hypothetical protein